MPDGIEVVIEGPREVQATTRVPQPNLELVSIYEQNELLRNLAEECRLPVCHHFLNINNRSRCVHHVDTELQKFCNLGHCAPSIKDNTHSRNEKRHLQTRQGILLKLIQTQFE